LDAKALLDALNRLGVTVPSEIKAAAAAGQPLNSVGQMLPSAVVNAALAASGLDTSERIRIKIELVAHGLLFVGRVR
jgi:hypothetical protein